MAVKRLDDFHALLRAHRQLPHRGGRVDLQAVLARELPHALRRRALVKYSTGAGNFRAQNHVFRDGHNRHKLKVLVHHPNA